MDKSIKDFERFNKQKERDISEILENYVKFQLKSDKQVSNKIFNDSKTTNEWRTYLVERGVKEITRLIISTVIVLSSVPSYEVIRFKQLPWSHNLF